MENNIYIPGDWVSWLGRKFKIDGVIVDPITKNKDYYEIAETGSRSIFKDDRLKPIPLTPKILEKNGWKPANVMLFTVYTKGLTLEYRLLLEKNIWQFKYEGKMLPIEIKYVHQLQHLLYGLGIKSEMEV